MRHSVYGRRLSRDINARKALLSNLASSLLENGQVTTTLVKAKFARGYIEKLVTKAKKNRLNAKRVLASTLTTKAFAKLTTEVAPALTDRAGGYTRIVRLRTRRGDAAQMAKIELMPIKLPEKSKDKKEPKEKVKAASGKPAKKPQTKNKPKPKAKGKNKK